MTQSQEEISAFTYFWFEIFIVLSFLCYCTQFDFFFVFSRAPLFTFLQQNIFRVKQVSAHSDPQKRRSSGDC
jgi:hypothetical protein